MLELEIERTIIINQLNVIQSCFTSRVLHFRHSTADSLYTMSLSSDPPAGMAAPPGLV